MNEIELKDVIKIRKISIRDCDIAQQNLCDVDPNNIDIETSIILTSLHNKGFNLGVEMAQKEFLDICDKLQYQDDYCNRCVNLEELKAYLSPQKKKPSNSVSGVKPKSTPDNGTKPEDTNNQDNDCRCCKGICNCEYGCDHPHDRNEVKA